MIHLLLIVVMLVSLERNAIDSGYGVFHISVSLGAPVFLMGPTDSTVTVGHGDSISITFVMEAYPPPTNITLRRNGYSAPITSTEQMDNITTVITLTFESVDYPGGGLYIIEASNTRGFVNTTFILHIARKTLHMCIDSGQFT